MSKKRLLFVGIVLLLSVVLILALTGCGRADEANEVETTDEQTQEEYSGRSLAIQVWPGSWEDVYTEQVYKPFQEKYGIEIISTTAVEWYSLAKIKTEVDSGNPQIDIVIAMPGDVVKGEQMGLWEELDTSKLTYYKDLYDRAKISPNTVGFLIYRYGYAYRQGDDVVEPPVNWADLADPRFKGKLTIPDSHPTYIIQSINYTLTGQMSPVDVDAVFAVLDRIKPNILNFNKGAGEIQDMINRKEVDISTMFDGRIYNMRDAGTPVEWMQFADATLAAFDYFAILKGSENADIAHLFLDFALQPEQQINVAKHLYYAPANSAAQLPQDLAEILPFGKDAIDALLFEDYEYVAVNEEAWWERWSAWLAE